MKDVKLIIKEVQEKYQEAIPYTFDLIVKDLEENRETVFVEFQNEITQMDEGEIWETIDLFYSKMFLRILFSLEKRKSFEKSLANFIDNIICNPQIYDFLIKEMPVFQEFEESLSPKWRKKFAKARAANKISNGISAFKSLGLSILFNKKSKKTLQEILENPVMHDRIKILILNGVGSND